MKFDSRNHKAFFDELKEDGYHIYARANAQENFYPNTFRSYPELDFSDLEEGDTIAVRAFFSVGKGAMPQVDSGQINLEVEFIDHEAEVVWGNIIMDLPLTFPLSRGTSIELTLDEILFVHSDD